MDAFDKFSMRNTLNHRNMDEYTWTESERNKGAWIAGGIVFGIIALPEIIAGGVVYGEGAVAVNSIRAMFGREALINGGVNFLSDASSQLISNYDARKGMKDAFSKWNIWGSFSDGISGMVIKYSATSAIMGGTGGSLLNVNLDFSNNSTTLKVSTGQDIFKNSLINSSGNLLGNG